MSWVHTVHVTSLLQTQKTHLVHLFNYIEVYIMNVIRKPGKNCMHLPTPKFTSSTCAPVSKPNQSVKREKP